MEVETLCFGFFSAKGTGQLHRIKGMIDEAMYCQGQGMNGNGKPYGLVVLMDTRWPL